MARVGNQSGASPIRSCAKKPHLHASTKYDKIPAESLAIGEVGLGEGRIAHATHLCQYMRLSPFSSSGRHSSYPANELDLIGFRVASVPEPGSLVMTAMIAVSGLLYYWRKHA